MSQVLEGSVRREAGRERVSARLVHVSDQAEQWGESYEREVSSILEVQNEAAQRAARAAAA